jgi:deoxyribodipyrimidine photo-lyase
MIQDDRIKVLKPGKPVGGRYVLYWMQASQRAEYNHALEFAIERANELDKPLVAFFGLTDRFPEANLRHYRFMLEGLAAAGQALGERGIKLVLKLGSPATGAVRMARHAALAVTDRGYLRIQRKWRREVARSIPCPLIQVESDVVVPVETASAKEEYAAATIRPKILARLDHYMVPLRKRRLRKAATGVSLKTEDWSDIESLVSRLKLDRSVGQAPDFRGGAPEARIRLDSFLKHELDKFAERRNDPGGEHLSNMSPYLHFGQISPLYVALKVGRTRSPGAEAYLEELIVRRELAMNFAYYNRSYDSYKCLPDWALKTLAEHKKDEREYVYTRRQLEAARTHDPYWNAAQMEMVLTGKMHGYMRMYWGKKILEWSRTLERGFRAAAYLNNKYELDGRDPNGFAGIAWCFGKHDRPWGERRIFGKVRYMNDKGLKRKFDMDAYTGRIDDIARGRDSADGRGDS